MTSERVPPKLLECLDAVRVMRVELVGSDTFLVEEGSDASLVNGETLRALLSNPRKGPL